MPLQTQPDYVLPRRDFGSTLSCYSPRQVAADEKERRKKMEEKDLSKKKKKKVEVEVEQEEDEDALPADLLEQAIAEEEEM